MKEKTSFRELKEIAQDPFPFLQRWKKNSGQRILGYFCTYTPEELIQGAGFLPLRITALRSISLASRHLQSYSCALVQSSLEAALQGELNFLEGTVFPHTCDSIQRLSDIWSANLRFPFHHDLVLPVKLQTPSARAYLMHELQRLRKALEEFSGRRVKDEDLQASFILANENRALLRELYRRRTLGGGPATTAPPATDFAVWFKTATILPKEDHNHRLKKFLAETSVGESSLSGVRLFLVGSLCDHLPLYDLFDSCGAFIVGDDLCTGWRYTAEDVSLQGDPMEALADRLLRKPRCPCKFNPEVDRAKDLLRRVEASQARGVVFLLLKFCDPHAFEYPYLREKFEERKIATLRLEIEPSGFSSAALHTRLQTFVETLEISNGR